MIDSMIEQAVDRRVQRELRVDHAYLYAADAAAQAEREHELELKAELDVTQSMLSWLRRETVARPDEKIAELERRVLELAFELEREVVS